MSGVGPARAYEHPSAGGAQALASSVVPRIQLFEFNELNWLPESVRNAITEILRVLSVSLRVHEVIWPVLDQLIEKTGSRCIVDLCSGAGGPVTALAHQLSQANIAIYLTDKFPNRPAFAAAEQMSAGRIRAYSDPVDASEVPAELKGIRTLFNAFHHFPPAAARRILEDAYSKSQPIAIFEITERTLLRTASNFVLSFLTMLLLFPKMRTKQVLWWPLTYVLPMLPAAFGWDGFVSCMRSYTADEFQSLVSGLDGDHYQWWSGRLPVPRTAVHISYFVGCPTLVSD